MSNVERNGDPNVAGGIALQGAISVLVNGKLMMVPGMPVTPHACCGQPGCGIHCSAQTSGGSSSVIVEGLPVIHLADIDTCGHKRSDPSPDVIVGM